MILDDIYILLYKRMSKNNSKHAILNASMTLVVLESFAVIAFFAYARILAGWQMPDKKWWLLVSVFFTVINYIRYESKEKTELYMRSFNNLNKNYKRNLLYGTLIYALISIIIPLSLAILEFNFGIKL